MVKLTQLLIVEFVSRLVTVAILGIQRPIGADQHADGDTMDILSDLDLVL